jgi:hypothetical protein
VVGAVVADWSFSKSPKIGWSDAFWITKPTTVSRSLARSLGLICRRNRGGITGIFVFARDQ